jgi:hypothetical protein
LLNQDPSKGVPRIRSGSTWPRDAALEAAIFLF